MDDEIHLSDALKKEQYYYKLLDDLISENNLKMKNELQTGDNYEEFISNKSQKILDRVIKLMETKEIPYLNAEQIIIKEFIDNNYK